MDPLSIAASAIGVGTACLQLAAAVYRYVNEVKEIDKTISLFGDNLKTLSTALTSVHEALSKHGATLVVSLGDDLKLLSSLDGW
jgi:hypothetical protein